MKQLLILIAMIGSALLATAQVPQDTSKPKEKVIYLFDNRDTVKVPTLVYKGADGTLRWCSPGYEIRTGRAYIADDRKKYWDAAGYKVSEGLDDKRRLVKTIDY